MQLHLQGGFGEKGRTSVAVEDGHDFIMLDAGIMVGALGEDYHPRLARPAREIGALFITHAHEDHVGALCHLASLGFRGPVYMTHETRAETCATLADYALAKDLAEWPPGAMDFRLFAPGDTIRVGELHVSTGQSGHVAGGVWFAVGDRQGRTLVYCGDVVPDSPVFPMTPLPRADILILDGSYGTDAQSMAARARDIAAWLAAHPGRCVLPTPLSGRSLELLAILDGPLAIASDMRAPLRAQIGAAGVRAGIVPRLIDRIESARDWAPGAALPDCPLLVHDGMGAAGPSRSALVAARMQGVPVLLTGHLPHGSPAERMYAEGTADWSRMPTHPTLPENEALWAASGRPPILAHSCEPAILTAMARAFPGLDPRRRTGDEITV